MYKHALTFFLLCFNLVASSQNWDIDLLRKVNSNRTSSATTLFNLASNSAYIVPFAYPVLSFAVGKIKKNNPLVRESFYSAVSLGTASLFSYSIKIMSKRPRPYNAYPNQLQFDKPSKTYSFPSGHTTVAFCTATSMALYYNKWYVTVPAYAWACSVAYSRMYLGKHYPTDVIGGIVLGMGIPFLLHFCKPINVLVDKAGKGLLKY